MKLIFNKPETQREQQIVHQIGQNDWSILGPSLKPIDAHTVVIIKNNHFRRVRWDQLKEQ